MASFSNVFGLKGRIGNMIFCKLNGKSYVRSVPVKNDSNTPKQQEMRSRFRVAVRFYQKLKETPLKKVLDLSAKGICGSGYSGYALFIKMNLKAFRADGKVGDFSLLSFAAGKKQQAYNLVGTRDERGMVTLCWENCTRAYDYEATDRLQVVVIRSNRSFSPELLEGLDVLRGAGKATFPLACGRGVTVHLYCFFVSPDGRRFSNSQHVKL